MTVRAVLRSVVALTCAATLAVGLITLLALRAKARNWLAFEFEGVPATLDQATSIFTQNLRVAFAPYAAVIALGSPWPRRPAWLAVRLLCDVVLAVTVLANVGVVGAALGAYDARMVGAILPHAPFELGAFALALTAYLLARRGPVAGGTLMRLALGTVTLLAVAALAETFVRL